MDEEISSIDLKINDSVESHDLGVPDTSRRDHLTDLRKDSHTDASSTRDSGGNSMDIQSDTSSDRPTDGRKKTPKKAKRKRVTYERSPWGLVCASVGDCKVCMCESVCVYVCVCLCV